VVTTVAGTVVTADRKVRNPMWLSWCPGSRRPR